MEKRSIIFKDCFKAFTTDQDKAIQPEDTLQYFYQQVKSLDIEFLNEVKRIDTGRLDIPVFLVFVERMSLNLLEQRNKWGKGLHLFRQRPQPVWNLPKGFHFSHLKKMRRTL